MTPIHLYQKGVCLVIPPELPLPTGFSWEREYCSKMVLLMMHPFDYVKTMWRVKTRGEVSIKYYVFNLLQTPQHKALPNPDHTIRIEHFHHDLDELGLVGDIDLPFIPQKELCLSTSAMVRRLYSLDFELGDYE